jgi:hypothetical protein
MFTVNITQFLQTECMRDYSASQAELGPTAGRDTWQACTENAPDWNFIPADELDYFREWLAHWGAWDRTEIAAMSDAELQALCLQWIAADARNTGADKPDADWSAIRADQESGRVPSSIYRDDDGSIYWECNE